MLTGCEGVLTRAGGSAGRLATAGERSRSAVVRQPRRPLVTAERESRAESSISHAVEALLWPRGWSSASPSSSSAGSLTLSDLTNSR